MDLTFMLAAWVYHLCQLPIRLCLTGVPGSGKTSIVKRVYTALFKNGVTGYVTDNADELVTFFKEKLKGTGIPVHAISMQYLDGVGVHLAPLLKSEADRIRFAFKLIADVKGDTSPFWNTSARLVLLAIVTALYKLSDGKFFLADIVRTARNQKLTSLICLQAKMPDPYASFGNNDSKRDVHSTLVSKLLPFSLYAAVDLRCPVRIDLPLESGVLVLEMTDTYVDALSGDYAFKFDTLADIYLSRQSLDPVLFGLEEHRDYKLDCIGRVGRRGRKSGISIILTQQEISGVYDRYGKEVADELMGLMDYKICLRLGSPTTAEWASSYLGKTESLQDISPLSTDGTNKSFSRSVIMRANVLPDELRNLPMSSYAKDTVEGWVNFPPPADDQPGITSRFTCKFKDAVTLKDKPLARERRPLWHQEMPKFEYDDMPRLGVFLSKKVKESLS
jgi:hypothetical protein